MYGSIVSHHPNSTLQDIGRSRSPTVLSQFDVWQDKIPTVCWSRKYHFWLCIPVRPSFFPCLCTKTIKILFLLKMEKTHVDLFFNLKLSKLATPPTTTTQKWKQYHLQLAKNGPYIYTYWYCYITKFIFSKEIFLGFPIWTLFFSTYFISNVMGRLFVFPGVCAWSLGPSTGGSVTSASFSASWGSEAWNRCAGHMNLTDRKG